MATYHATSVSILADLDHGEGWILFQWPDPIYGYEELSINSDGFCSRRRSIQSGNGPPRFVDIQRDRIVLEFSPRLAKRLEMEERVEIQYEISENDLHELREFVEMLGASEAES
jgi:hypothetical protein